MRKLILPTLLTLTTLACNLGSSIPTYATVEKDDITYWSAAELADYTPTEGYDRLYESFMSYRFLMTSVNPSLETAKFLYRDTDHMSFDPDEAPNPLKEAYVVWVDPDTPESHYLYKWFNGTSWSFYPYYAHNINPAIDAGDGVPDELDSDIHVVLGEWEGEQGAGWFTPNVEVERSIAGSDIKNSGGQLYYFWAGVYNRANSIGPIIFSDCLNSPDYQDGMECRAMFGTDGSLSYMPFWPEPVQEEKGGSDDSDPVILATAEEKGITIPKAPETGSAASENACNAAEFPWWLVVSLIAADILFLWWVAPNRKKVKKI